jgi:beta-galactosidase
MFDFASDARDEGDTPGRNDKGLVSYDRREKKDAFWLYKAVWSDEAVVHIAGGDSRTVRHDHVDLKVYSNADSVDLRVNGVSQGVRESVPGSARAAASGAASAGGGDGVFRWDGVQLSEGANEIKAAGSFDGAVIEDVSTLLLVPGNTVWLPAVTSRITQGPLARSVPMGQ